MTAKTIFIESSQHSSATIPGPTNPNDQVNKLEHLVQESEGIIYEASSVFPFQLFPDKIIIDKNKVTVVRNMLFSNEHFLSVSKISKQF